MYTPLPYVVAAIALAGFLNQPAAAASYVQQGQFRVTVSLMPSESAPAEAAGSAEIRVKQKSATIQKSNLKLNVSGMATGTYSVDATLNGGSPEESSINLATLELTASSAEATDAGDFVDLTLPTELDVRSISQFTVSLVGEESSTVVLTGDPSTDIAKFRFFVNARLSAEDATFTDDKGKVRTVKVKGRVLILSQIKDNAEKKRHFLLVVQGMPRGAELNLNVNGEKVADVSSTPQGKLKLKEDSLPADLDLSSIESLSITDSEGNLLVGLILSDLF